MRVTHVTPGTRFASPFGGTQETKATKVLVDDGRDAGWDHAGWSLPGCEDTGKPGNLHVVTVNRWTEVAAWLAGTGHAGLAASLDEHALRSLANLVLWHELGHAILGMRDNQSPWRRRVAETWCDALGTAAMLAAGGSHDAARAADAFHGPARLPLEGGFDEDAFRVDWAHDTSGACLAVLRRWRAAPWPNDLAGLLAIATAATLEVAPDEAADASRLAAMLTAGRMLDGRHQEPVHPGAVLPHAEDGRQQAGTAQP